MKKIFLAIGFVAILAGCGEQERILEDKKEEIKEGIAQKQEKMKEENAGEEKVKGWKAVETDLFKIEFPDDPVNQSTDVPVAGSELKLKMNMYVHETDDFAYLLNTTEYPIEMGELDLAGALNGMAQSHGGNEIVSSNTENFNGYKAMNYKLKNKVEKDTYLQGKLIIADRTMYQLMYGYTGEDNFNEEDYNKFINSFELK